MIARCLAAREFGRIAVKCDMIRVVLLLLLVFGAPLVAAIALPSAALAEEKSDAEKKKKEKKRGEPVKKIEPIITQLPGISDNARCQAEVAVAAFKRLGALPVLLYMSSGLANAAAAGTTAAMGYCAQNVKVCTDSAEVLLPKVGELPPSCAG
jgi:hypothetical protein